MHTSDCISLHSIRLSTESLIVKPPALSPPSLHPFFKDPTAVPPVAGSLPCLPHHTFLASKGSSNVISHFPAITRLCPWFLQLKNTFLQGVGTGCVILWSCVWYTGSTKYRASGVTMINGTELTPRQGNPMGLAITLVIRT